MEFTKKQKTEIVKLNVNQAREAVRIIQKTRYDNE